MTDKQKKTNGKRRVWRGELPGSEPQTQDSCRVSAASSHSLISAACADFCWSSSCDWRWLSSALTKFCSAVSRRAMASSASAILFSSSWTRSSICLRLMGFKRKQMEDRVHELRSEEHT